tara:strand:- start:3905 stop:4675 length:771 start_codon:yes stop_codon:yes gene_type:complete
MKSRKLLILLIIISNTLKTYSQNCNEINQLADNFNKPLINKGVDMAFEQAIKYFLGNATYLLHKSISPSKIDSPKDQYAMSLNELRTLMNDHQKSNEETKIKIKKELENLLLAEDGLIIENGYKVNSECYKVLKNLSESIIKVAFSPNVLNICQFYRFFGELKMGTHCGKESSGQINVINTTRTRMTMFASFQKEDGSWSDWESSNVYSGDTRSWWVCSTNGNYIVLGVDKDVNDKYKCKRMSQQMAFDYPKTILD